MASSIRAMAGEIALIESPPEFTLAENHYCVVLIENIPEEYELNEESAKTLLGMVVCVGPQLLISPSGVHFQKHLRTAMLFFDKLSITVPYALIISKVSIEITKIVMELGIFPGNMVCYMSGFKTKGQLFVYALCKCYGMYLSYIQSLSPGKKISSTDLHEKTLVEIAAIIKDEGVDIINIPDAETYGIVWSLTPKTKKIRHLSGIFDGRNEQTYLSFIYN
jgi:hypothetical protein